MTSQRKLLLIIESKDLLEDVEHLIKRSFDAEIKLFKSTIYQEIHRVLMMQYPQLIVVEASVFAQLKLNRFEYHDIPTIIIGAQNSFEVNSDRNQLYDWLSIHELERELPEKLKEFFKFNKKRINGDKGVQNTQLNVNQSFLNIWNADKIRPVKISDIVKIKSDGAYSDIYLSNNERLYTSRNIGVFELKLKAFNFIRIHHSCLVNLDYIKFYKPGQKAYVSLNEAGVEYVSKSKKRHLLDHFILIKNGTKED